MDEKYIQVILDELYERKILIKENTGYRVSRKFAYDLSQNSVKFESMITGLLMTIIDWVQRPTEDIILEYYDVLSTMIDMKQMEKMLI